MLYLTSRFKLVLCASVPSGTLNAAVEFNATVVPLPVGLPGSICKSAGVIILCPLISKSCIIILPVPLGLSVKLLLSVDVVM